MAACLGRAISLVGPSHEGRGLKCVCMCMQQRALQALRCDSEGELGQGASMMGGGVLKAQASGEGLALLKTDQGTVQELLRLSTQSGQ